MVILMRIRLLCAALLALTAVTLAPIAAPQVFTSSAWAAVVRQIVVEGNQRVEYDTVMSYLQFSVGQDASPEKIDESVKVLFQTGLFADVQIINRGGTLVIKVVENPLINQVNFEGNTAIDDKALQKEVEVKERMIFTRAQAQSDTQRVLALYQKAGYYNVNVAPKIIRHQDNRVNLVFEINEQGKTTIKSINFTGNNAFSGYALRSVMATKEHSWWNYFQRNDTYDADRLEYDKELLRRYYLKHGFADIEIVSAEAQLSPDGENFDVNITLSEGSHYTIADVAVDIGSSNLDPEKLRDVVKTGVGDSYDASKVDKTVENLTLEASRQGYVFARVEPKVDRNSGVGSLNLSYTVAEGTRAYVERIEITGNRRTLDDVVRRELQIFEGDAFNRTLVERARRRLTALDFFDKIDFREEEGSAPDKVVLFVDLVEKSTGKIAFSLGYSSTEKVIGSVELTERNLLGKGQFLRINTTASFKKQSVDFSFTEPYFMGMPISAGFDLFATNTDNTDFSSYKSRQVGGALRTGFDLDEYSSLDFKYYVAFRKTKGIDASIAAPAIIAQEGNNWKSSVGATYTWDDLDNPNIPTTGFRGQLDGEVAGLGGTTRYGRLEAHGWYFFPVYEESVVLKLEGNAGHIQSFGGKDVPLQDRFFHGSDTFRGFAKAGVGPRQVNNGGGTDSIGANSYAIGTVEMTFPVGLPEGWGISGAAFTDFGTVFGSDDDSVLRGAGTCTSANSAKNCDVFKNMAFRASVGAGLIWQSPFGPLRFEVAYPLLKADYDEKELFRFSIGTRF